MITGLSGALTAVHRRLDAKKGKGGGRVRIDNVPNVNRKSKNREACGGG